MPRLAISLFRLIADQRGDTAYTWAYTLQATPLQSATYYVALTIHHGPIPPECFLVYFIHLGRLTRLDPFQAHFSEPGVSVRDSVGRGELPILLVGSSSTTPHVRRLML